MLGQPSESSCDFRFTRVASAWLPDNTVLGSLAWAMACYVCLRRDIVNPGLEALEPGTRGQMAPIFNI